MKNELTSTKALPAALNIPEAAALLRISRCSAYEAARRGEIPTVRVGRRILVPTARLLQVLGVNEPLTE